MGQIWRVLHTDVEVERFVDGVLDTIKNDTDKRDAISRISEVERCITYYYESPTWDHMDYRDYSCRENSVREDLRNRIVEELFENKQLNDDNEIKLGYGGAAPQTETKKEKKAIYLIGPPASGKSTIASIVARIYGAYIIDSDYAKRKLPEYNKLGGATLVHEESSHLVFDTTSNSLLYRCLKEGINIVVPKIGDKLDSIVDFARLLKSVDYSVYLISVDLDRQKATQRAYYRYKDTLRYVPLSLIFDEYSNQPTLNYFKVKQRNEYKRLFKGFAQISTDVPKGAPAKPIEIYHMNEIKNIDWRI